MKKHIKRTFLILIIAIYLVTACIPLTASAIDEYAVFALNFISQEDEYVTLSVGLSFESFSKADIRVEPSDKNAVCTEIKETDDFVSLCESLNNESHIALYQMNPETKSVSLSSTSTFNKLADYFIYTFKMPNKDKITKYDFTLSVNGIEYDVINNLPKDDTEKASGDFTYIVKNGEAVIVSFNQYFSGAVEIPSEIEGYTVTKINPFSFKGCSGITSITIPESVTEIGCYAFADCSALQEAKINGKITSINNNTFENCTNLKNVNIPQTVEQIGDYAFAGCSSITEITLPDKLTSLGEYAFYRCGSLKDIVIPDYVEKISAECFNGCSSLSNVMIGSSVKTIEYFAFYNCVALTTVEIKSDIDLIQISAFNNCPYISKIYVAVSSELWNDVEIEEMNTSFSSAKFYYDIYFMNGHHYNIKKSVPASCTTDGYIYYICCDCNDIYTQVIPKGHEWNGWTLESRPTKEADGKAVKKCGVCFAKETKLLPKITGSAITDGSFIYGIQPMSSANDLNCIINFPEADVKLSGTNKNIIVTGTKLTVTYPDIDISFEYEFVLFGDVNADGKIDAMDATLISLISVGMLTESQIGSAKYFAADCNHDGVVDNFDISMVNYVSVHGKGIDQTNTPEGEHKYDVTVVNPTCEEGGYTIHTCSVCGDTYIDNETSALGHKYSDEWTVDVQPTYTSSGLKSKHCIRCKSRIEETVIPPLQAISPNENGAVIDYEKGIIYGIQPGEKSLDKYFTKLEDDIQLTYSTNKIGTGTKVNVYKADELLVTYTVVLFGDVNCDSNCDAMDSIVITFIAVGMNSKDSLDEFAAMAADCNHDGWIDSFDTEIINLYSMGFGKINQK